jgi:hypothetical protein
VLGSEDAGRRRAEREHLGAGSLETRGAQQVLDLFSGFARGVLGGSGTAGLGDDGDAPSWGEPSAEVGELVDRCGPEAEGVDGEDGVERAFEGVWELIHRCLEKGYATGFDGGCVASGRLAEHHVGVVDAVDVAGSPAHQLRYCDAGSEADLQDGVGGSWVQK